MPVTPPTTPPIVPPTIAPTGPAARSPSRAPRSIPPGTPCALAATGSATVAANRVAAKIVRFIQISLHDNCARQDNGTHVVPVPADETSRQQQSSHTPGGNRPRYAESADPEMRDAKLQSAPMFVAGPQCIAKALWL